MAKYVPRERKHRRLAKQKTQNSQDDAKAQAEIILPLSKPEEEQKRALRDQLIAQRQNQGNTNINSKKRKRLDKYIDTKLKKEENLELLKKLSVLNGRHMDTSLLQSSKKLGQVKETNRERFRRALNERRAGIDVNGDQNAVLFERRPDISKEQRGEEDGDEDDESEEGDQDDEQDVAMSIKNSHKDKKETQPSIAFGSGLKRPLEVDGSGQPIIKKRKRQKKKETKAFNFKTHVTKEDDSGSNESEGDNDDRNSEEWNGFDDDSQFSQSMNGSEDDDTESSSATSDESDAESDPENEKPARVSAFKAWAEAKRNEAIGFVPSAVPATDDAIKAAFRPRPLSPDPVTTELYKLSASPAAQLYRPSQALSILRTEKIQSARLELPVVQEEQRIIEAIHNNLVVVVCGATGSGKTTQLPQMLLENGYATKGMIGITQPRRVAATSVAARVSSELGDDFGKQVAHQVRYDSNVGRETTIKFMTDGILLREMGQDFSLSKYSAIVVDEAHERSVNTDILIGMLSRIVPLRNDLSQEQPEKYVPLKLIIMSASLRVTDFILNDRLFPKVKPPIIEAEGRQYPVTIHFARRTHRDYVSETVSKISRGHKKLPPGGMLVFLTGQDEIQSVAKRLKEMLSESTFGLPSARTKARLEQGRKSRAYIEEQDPHEDSSSDTEIRLDDEASEDEDDDFLVEEDTAHGTQKGPLKPLVLPLYASLPSDQQMRVFDPPPEGTRLIVLSTNVAETSLTIPGVRYVFDCGRSKEKRYDEVTGVQEFKIDWISKASALQRTGRAGRTGPGHCYRLYSSAIYEQYFDEHTVPEILRTPIEGTVLQLKSMSVDNVINFPFPTPPRVEQLAQAERLLKNLGAIDRKVGRVSDLGKELIKYPVNPRFGKMLILGSRNGVLDYAVALVAALAVGDLFIAEPQLHNNLPTSNTLSGDDASDSEYRSQPDKESSILAQKQRQAYGRAHAELSSQDDQSDVIKMLTAVAVHAQAEIEKRQKPFCAQYFLREKGMSEVQQLRRQLHNITHGQIKVPYSPTLRLAKAQDVKLLKQIVAAGFIDQVAIRADLLPAMSEAQIGRKPRRAIEVAYRTLMPSNYEIDRTADIDEQEKQKNVYIHSASLLARLSVKEMPNYIVYSHLSRAPATKIGASQQGKIRMHPLAVVGPKQLAALAEGTPLLEIGKPIGKVENISLSKRECWVGIALRDPAVAGSTSWPLGAWKVVQVKKLGDWIVEKVLARG